MSSKRSCRYCRHCGLCCLGSLGLLLIAAGACIVSLFMWQFDEQMKLLMPLANGSMSYQGWEKVPTDLLFEIWVWNVTNPTEIIDKGARPRLQQVGPFAFRETRHKEDIEFFPNNTVAFKEYQTFYFDLERSVGDPKDFKVTSVNMPYAVMAFQTQPLGPFTRRAICSLYTASSDGLFVTKSAKEILLGYEDVSLASVEPLVRRYAPYMEFQSTTGLFIGTNNTDKGTFLVHTGKGDLAQFNRVQRWKGRENISIWNEAWANQIVGTDGSMFPPKVTKDRKLEIFTTDICRSIMMEYKGEGSVLGIQSARFGPVPDLMDNATLKPENEAFCMPRCLDSGVLNITKCQRNVPLAISAPHFTGAPTYAAAIASGLNPGPQYETEIELEPNTGFVINAGRKMQMNAILQPVEGFDDTRKLPDPLLMPLMWLNESGGIEAEAAAKFKSHLLAPIQIVHSAQLPLIATGLLLLLAAAAGAAITCCAARRRHAASRTRAKHKHNLAAYSSGIILNEEMIATLKRGDLKETDIC